MAKGDGGGGMMGRFANAAMRGGNAIQGATQQPGLGGFMQANPNFGGGKFANMQKPAMMGNQFNMPGQNYQFGGGMFNPSGGFGNMKPHIPQGQDLGMGPSPQGPVDPGFNMNQGDGSYNPGGMYSGGPMARNTGIFGGGFAGGLRSRRGFGF